MSDNAIAVTFIATVGAVLAVVAWQLLAIARTAVARRHDGDSASPEALDDVRHRLERLERRIGDS